MHIGLIGGIGPAATEFYYRGLVGIHSATSCPLELTIAHADMGVLLGNLAAGTPEKQANVFRHHVEQLAGAGATVAAVTSIAGHFCFRELEAISPLPLISALTTLAQELDRRELSRVGLLGSKAAMETRLFGTVTGVEVVLPRGDDLFSVSDEYFAMAGAQRATAAQRELFFTAGARLCSEQGAEVVILVGTDMFLAFAGTEPGFEFIDSAEVHIQALADLTAVRCT
jgi:aspartate racemase